MLGEQIILIKGNVMKYLSKNRLWLGMLIGLMLSFNIYTVWLMKAASIQQIVYLDVLLGVLILLVLGVDAAGYYKRQAVKERLLACDYVICREMGEQEDTRVAEHDVMVLEEQLREQFDQNCDLQDYIAAWCHEIRLPLSACLLMNEKIPDLSLRMAQKEQLELICQRLNGVLLGCKVQSSLFDLQICAADLMQCVKTAIHNNQYFLIRHQFEIVLQVEPLKVYTDPSWLVYVLDQLIQNAMKYSMQSPTLRIQSIQKGGQIQLMVEDNGEGIQKSDIRRIFERGYTGSNHHNGQYKSTGMGLYMAALILDRLGHTITVESEYGAYTRFYITFREAGSMSFP